MLHGLYGGGENRRVTDGSSPEELRPWSAATSSAAASFVREDVEVWTEPDAGHRGCGKMKERRRKCEKDGGQR